MCSAITDLDAESDLIDAVQSDPDARPFERETSYRFDATDEERMIVYSGMPSQIRGWLRHEYFDPSWFVITTDRHHFEVDTVHEARELIEDEGASITGLRGTLPIGCLTIKAGPRASNSVGQVVNA